MASLSDKAGFLIAANFVKYAVGFVMPMVLVRMLSKNDYGTFQQIQLIGAAASGVMMLGLQTSVFYFYDDKGSHSRTALIQQTLGMLLLSGIVTGIAIALATPLFAVWMNNEALPAYLPIFAIAVALGIASEHFVSFMIAQDRYAMAVAFETGETIVRVIVMVAPLLAGYGLKGMIIAFVVMVTGRFLVRQWLLLRGVAWYRKPAPGTTFFKEQLAYSLPMCMTSIVGLVAGLLDRMMIASSFSPADYATYAVGALEIPLDVIFQAAVANVLRASMPGLVRDGRLDEIVRLVRESVRKLSILVLPSFVFLLGYSYEFIVLLFTKNYADSVSVFRVYLFLLPLHMFILSPIPQAFGKTKANLYIVGSVTAVHVVISYVLLQWLGYLGPAVSMVATQYLQSLLYLVVGLRLLGTTTVAMTPLGGFARVLAAAGASVLICRLLFSGTSIGLSGLLAAGALFTALYAVFSLVFGVFQSQDRALAMRWLGRLGLLPKKA